MTELEKARLKRAQEIADKVKSGTYIPAAFDAAESFFPQRPIIKKDKNEMKRIYGKDV
jgi:hypothetical protein